jgi:hypothetical protein
MTTCDGPATKGVGASAFFTLQELLPQGPNGDVVRRPNPRSRISNLDGQSRFPIPDSRFPIPEQRCLTIASSSGTFIASLCLGSSQFARGTPLLAPAPRTSAPSSARRSVTAAAGASTVEPRSISRRPPWTTCSRWRVAGHIHLGTSWPPAARATAERVTCHRRNFLRAILTLD